MVTMPRSFSAQAAHSSEPSVHDPYRYQAGFGNRFASEAIQGVLPVGQNTPQRVRYDLYCEQLNGSAFVSSRAELKHVWMYRILPAVMHGEVTSRRLPLDVEADFSLSNASVEVSAAQYTWAPRAVPEGSSLEGGAAVDFVDGIKTYGGQGECTSGEGLAIHIYAANSSMHKRAFSSADGDMLILPQQGRLDIQTELGHLMVRPGELVVVPRGIRFSVDLPEGPSRGYIQEVFGAHYELPELGPIGSNGLAYPRDFESPVASFDVDTDSSWEVVYKLAGQMHSYTQTHTPFDVVAWHGNYVPFKYDMSKFINIGCLDREQNDPTCYCVLTARPNKNVSVAAGGASLTDFLIFTPRWSVTTNTFRPPYYHRNMSSEIMGLIYGQHGSSSHELAPGGLSYEASFMPHGETYEAWREASTRELEHTRVAEGSLAFMFHIGAPVALTDYALKRSSDRHQAVASTWDSKPLFLKHLAAIEQKGAAVGSNGLYVNGHAAARLEVIANGH